MMNKKAEFNDFIILAVLFMLIPISSVYLFFIMDDDLGYSFCERKGYDSINRNGGYYSNHYQKIECIAGFKENKTSKIFDVERKFGIFFEINEKQEEK